MRPGLKQALQNLKIDGAAPMLAGVGADVFRSAETSPQQVAVQFRTFQSRLENRPRQEVERVLVETEPRVGCRQRFILPKPVLLLDQTPGLGNAFNQRSQGIVVSDPSTVHPVARRRQGIVRPPALV